MPMLFFTPESTGINILKPVSDQVTTALLSSLGIYDLFENAIYSVSSFEANSQYDDGAGGVSLVKNRCDIAVSYGMDANQVPWPEQSRMVNTGGGIRGNMRGHHSPILVDKKAGVLVEYYTKPTSLDMEFTLTLQTYDDATRVYDQIATQFNGSNTVRSFDIYMSFPVTMSLLEFLMTVYKCKTDYVGKDLMDYLHDMQVARISWDVRTTQLLEEKPDKALMVRAPQLGCVGELIMDQKEPEVIRNNQLSDSFTIAFRFQFQFGRPSLIVANTPVSIDNTLLPDGFFTKPSRSVTWSGAANGVYQDQVLNPLMKANYGNYAWSSQVVRLPSYDDWIALPSMYRHYEYQPLLIGHFTLDGAVSTIDLKNLGDVALHPTIIAIMKETYSELMTYGGIFNVSVYANDVIMMPEVVSISEDLVITINSTRPDQVYHFVISESTTLAKMTFSQDALLIKYRYFFPLTIARNIDRLIQNGYYAVEPDPTMISLVNRMLDDGSIDTVVNALIAAGEVDLTIYGYMNAGVSLVDFMANRPSDLTTYVVPNNPVVQEYYATKASIDGRSLLVAFIEQCLINDIISLDAVPDQYLVANADRFPPTRAAGTYYGFNSPLRVGNFTIAAQHSTD